MKSAKDRDDMVKRATAALKKWPTFAALPDGQKGARTIKVEGDPNNAANYHRAMYELCALATPIGRQADTIVGA
ncbi:hypothetical protein [Mesorhizobium sp. WSM3626]|uniref:hypothetical protein n=1 Tax=Mesorhizobium sp. WSM3626 TaxID=1040987 RepID=UPI000486CD35|nr:hypothetical protein [Mesorhizobium sp. WSM3626]